MADDPGYQETILIVDDSEDSRNLLASVLGLEGYNVIEADCGQAALQKVRERLPDLILLDIMMPGMDGFEVCQQLKRDDRLKEIPIIFLSGLGKTKNKIQGLEIGGADYIAKPFHVGEAMARIRSHLKIRRLTKDILDANRKLREKQERLDEDLRAAAGIQMSLLPKHLPASSQLEMAWKFIPSETIGGDIFNVLLLDDNHFAIYMLDVSGHGVPSALVTVSVSQVLQAHQDGILRQVTAEPPYYRIPGPEEVLSRLDRDYPIDRFDKYFTIFYGVLHTDRHELTYSNGGHPPPLLLRADGQVELLEEGGPLIGMGISVFETGRKTLVPGDKIILYTDGVVDGQNERGEFYGLTRFSTIVTGSKDETIAVLLDKVVEDLRQFCGAVKPGDDIALLGIAYG